MPGGITGKGFVKGDPRINRKGVPAEAIQMRHMLREIAAEVIQIRTEHGRTVEVSRLYARARLLFSSRNFKEFELALKAMYPDLLKQTVKVEGTGENGELVVRFVDDTGKAE